MSTMTSFLTAWHIFCNSLWHWNCLRALRYAVQGLSAGYGDVLWSALVRNRFWFLLENERCYEVYRWAPGVTVTCKRETADTSFGTENSGAQTKWLKTTGESEHVPLICLFPNAPWQPQQRAEKRKWMKLYPYDSMRQLRGDRFLMHFIRVQN